MAWTRTMSMVVLAGVGSSACWYTVADLVGDGGLDATVSDAPVTSDVNGSDVSPPQCGAVDATCTSAPDCCTKICGGNGTCACSVSGKGYCTKNADCCYGFYCEGLDNYCYCIPPGDAPDALGGNGDCAGCCTKTCRVNDAGSTVCACFDAGTPCTNTIVCCSGICNFTDAGGTCN